MSFLGIRAMLAAGERYNLHMTFLVMSLSFANDSRLYPTWADTTGLMLVLTMLLNTYVYWVSCAQKTVSKVNESQRSLNYRVLRSKLDFDKQNILSLTIFPGVPILATQPLIIKNVDYICFINRLSSFTA